MPPKNETKGKAQGKDPDEPKRRDSKEVGIWRGRLGTEEAQTIYQRRAP